MKQLHVLMVVLIVIAINPVIHAQVTTTTISPQCTLELIPSSVSLYTWETVQFSTTASGSCNTPCYTWEISVMGSAGSTINNNGLYTAGSSIGTDLVTVSDPCNNDISDSATVNVGTTTTTLPASTSTTTVGSPEGATYLINGSNPLALSMDGGSCQTVSIAIDPSGVINTPLITAGCWLNTDPGQMTIGTVAAADGTVPDPGIPVLPVSFLIQKDPVPSLLQ